MVSSLRATIRHAKEKYRNGRRKHEEQPPPPSPESQDRLTTDTDVHAAASYNPSKNLWEVAGEKLDEEHRKALGLESALPITDAIEDVIETTEQKYREYKEGGLNIRKRDGGHINVRDSAKNIILHALQVQDLIKTLVSFDPTGHGEYLEGVPA